MSATAIPIGDIRDAAERIEQAGLILTRRRVLIGLELLNGAQGMNLVCSVADGSSKTIDNIDVEQVTAVANVLEALATLGAD